MEVAQRVFVAEHHGDNHWIVRGARVERIWHGVGVEYPVIDGRIHGFVYATREEAQAECDRLNDSIIQPPIEGGKE